MYQVYTVNEAMCPVAWTLRTTQDTFTAAERSAHSYFGDPARKRRFACAVVIGPDGTKTEIVRGQA